MATATVSHAPAPPAARGALALPGAATLLALMNYCAPMTTLPAVAAGLRAGAAAQIWLLSGISIGLVAALSPAGSLADNHGRKRVFVAGAAVLALASAGCALAPDAGVFVAGRIGQGAASGALLATGLGVIAHSFPAGPPRARATGIWGAMLGAGIALGPLVSSALAMAAGWRSWYWLAVPASGLLAVTAAAALPDSRAQRHHRPDLPGALTMTAGVSALMTAVTLGRAGWSQPAVPLLAAAGIALLALFCRIEARRPDPMIDLGLLRHRGFLAAALGALFTGLAVIGIMSYLSTVLERTLGLPPLGTALLFAVWSGLSFLVALQARRLAGRLPGRWQLALGLLLSAAGEFALLLLAPGGGWLRLLPGLVIAGTGSGLANAALARLAVDSVPPDRASMGSGANNTARYIGSSLGVAMVVTIANRGVAAASGPAAQAAALAHGATLAILVSALLALLAAGLAAVIRD